MKAERKKLREEGGREKYHTDGKRTEGWRQKSVVLLKNPTTFPSLIL